MTAPKAINRIKLVLLGFKRVWRSFVRSIIANVKVNRRISVATLGVLLTSMFWKPNQRWERGQKSSSHPVKKSPISECERSAA